jgi:hypothetical protein
MFLYYATGYYPEGNNYQVNDGIVINEELGKNSA